MQAADSRQYIVNQPDVAQRMSRALGMVGTGLPSEIRPQHGANITVEDLTHPEFWWLRRGLRYGVGFTLAAVAAQFAYGEIFIRTSGARKLVVLEHVYLSNPGAAAVFGEFGFGSAVAAGTTREPAPTDDRYGNPTGVPAGSACLANFGNNAAPVRPNVGIQFCIPANGVLDVGPIVMTGNANFTVIGTVANQPLGITFLTRERPLLDTER